MDRSLFRTKVLEALGLPENIFDNDDWDFSCSEDEAEDLDEINIENEEEAAYVEQVLDIQIDTFNSIENSKLQRLLPLVDKAVVPYLKKRDLPASLTNPKPVEKDSEYVEVKGDNSYFLTKVKRLRYDPQASANEEAIDLIEDQIETLCQEEDELLKTYQRLQRMREMFLAAQKNCQEKDYEDDEQDEDEDEDEDIAAYHQAIYDFEDRSKRIAVDKAELSITSSALSFGLISLENMVKCIDDLKEGLEALCEIFPGKLDNYKDYMMIASIQVVSFSLVFF